MAQQKMGDCEVCPATNTIITLRHSNIWFCEDCWDKELTMQKATFSPDAVKARVENVQLAAPANQILQEARNIDASITVRTDVFNAATAAIVEIKKVIDADATITNKPYALASELMTRYKHFGNVIFQAQETIVDGNNNQRAIQQYLNNMANQLRAEEREKLKIADINYRPNPVKQPTVKSIKTVGTTPTKKATKADISKAAKELGIAEFTLHAFVLQSGGDLELAVKKIKASIEAAKQVK